MRYWFYNGEFLPIWRKGGVTQVQNDGTVHLLKQVWVIPREKCHGFPLTKVFRCIDSGSCTSSCLGVMNNVQPKSAVVYDYQDNSLFFGLHSSFVQIMPPRARSVRHEWSLSLLSSLFVLCCHISIFSSGNNRIASAKFSTYHSRLTNSDPCTASTAHDERFDPRLVLPWPLRRTTVLHQCEEEKWHRITNVVFDRFITKSENCIQTCVKWVFPFSTGHITVIFGKMHTNFLSEIRVYFQYSK